jgi:serine/threonine protein kinase
MNFSLDETALKQWIEESIKTETNTLAAGYQGKTLLFDDGKNKYAIKIPHGKGLVRYFHTHMLRHEHEAYKRLGNDFPGIPACYGLVDNKYLVLEYIAGRTIRMKRPLDEPEYMDMLLEIINNMHSHGVAHMDLKRKDNLLVTSNERPCLLDFGASVIEKHGFHPINHFKYRLAKQFDYNAWIKHKYHDRLDDISDEDRPLYKVTWTESIASKIKSLYTKR